VFAYRYVEMYERTYAVPSLDFGVAIFIFGMQAVLLSTSIIGFMLFWEVMSLSSFVLVMADRTEASRKAALLYFVMAQLGAAAIMAGFVLVAGGNPFADFAALAASAKTLTPLRTLLAFALFFIGFGSKAGLVPLHTWLPEAHPQAPSHVSALMSSAMLKIAVYGFIFVMSTVFPSLAVGFSLAVIGIGLLSAVFGILHASVEHDIKRAIAWHSIENLGLIFAMIGISMFARESGMILLSEIALAAALFHAINHAIFKSGLFLSTGVIMSQMHTRDIEEMGGLAKRMPYFTVAICALTLSGAALPPFGTFYDEWMFVQGLVGNLAGAAPFVQAVFVATMVVVAFCGGLAVFAMTKLFALPCLGQPRSEEAAHMKEPPASMNGPVLLFAAAGLLSGVFAADILRTIGASNLLHGGAVASIAVSSGSLAPVAIFALVVAVILCLVLAKRVLGNSATRAYHTWDCGQPITPRMEYTATAFSAPIRFFFRNLVGVRKSVVIVPSSSQSPLAVKREMLMVGRSFWISHVHEPIARAAHRLGKAVSRVQSGSIQRYLLIIFVALAATLLIAL
jgi:hydrogenase-4 component B